MHVKHFTMVPHRVVDPMRPGRTVETGRLMPSGADSLSYSDANGKAHAVEPDANGWFEVPHEVGTQLCRFRVRGSGYFTPGEVLDQVRLGALDDADLPARKDEARKRPASKAAED